jgi:hypothetical protein
MYLFKLPTKIYLSASMTCFPTKEILKSMPNSFSQENLLLVVSEKISDPEVKMMESSLLIKLLKIILASKQCK